MYCKYVNPILCNDVVTDENEFTPTSDYVPFVPFISCKVIDKDDYALVDTGSAFTILRAAYREHARDCGCQFHYELLMAHPLKSMA